MDSLLYVLTEEIEHLREINANSGLGLVLFEDESGTCSTSVEIRITHSKETVFVDREDLMLIWIWGNSSLFYVETWSSDVVHVPEVENLHNRLGKIKNKGCISLYENSNLQVDLNDKCLRILIGVNTRAVFAEGGKEYPVSMIDTIMVMNRVLDLFPNMTIIEK